MVQRGLIQIYTGEGKGKTTAALGLCFRAAGWGIRSAFIQFMKNQDTGELHSAGKLKDLILFEQYGSSSFLKNINSPQYREHLYSASTGLARAEELLKENRFSIIVLDEILTLPQFKLAPESRILELITMKPDTVELVLTGRGATENLIQHADLVTEMKDIKHYFSKGIIARKGIEF